MKLSKKELDEDFNCDMEIVTDDLNTIAKAIYQIMDKMKAFYYTKGFCESRNLLKQEQAKLKKKKKKK